MRYALCAVLFCSRRSSRQKYRRLGISEPVSASSCLASKSFQREFVNSAMSRVKTSLSSFDSPKKSTGFPPWPMNWSVLKLIDHRAGTMTARAAKNATRTIPIVFLRAVSDPVALGLVDSLARPGGNITGFTTIAPELAGKRLELLKETIPKLSRVAVLWDPQNAGSDASMERKPTAGKRTGSAASFHGGKQRRRIRERVQRGS